MKTKQITITEYNDWEGETFSYIMDVTQDTLDKLIEGLKDEPDVEIEQDTEYTKERVELLNYLSDNTYMSRYMFVESPDLKDVEDYYADLIYKGVGLKRIR